MQVLSTLALVGISTLLSAPVDARAGPFRMVRPINVTTAASGASHAASNTALVTAVYLHPTVIPTGGSSPHPDPTTRSLPHSNPTITVSRKPTATPSTPSTYHNADHPRNPGYVCRKDYSRCYARAPHPPDSDFVKAMEANDQESLEAHEKKSTLATENDDVCHAEFKTCLGFGPGPVLPESNDGKVISPRQRNGQEKHTLPPQQQEKPASEEARIALDFNHEPIPVDAPSVHEASAVAKDQPLGFGLGPVLPRSEEGLEPRAYLTEEEQKEHYKSFRFGKIPVRSGPMGVGPILPRDSTLENKESQAQSSEGYLVESVQAGQIHDKPTLESNVEPRDLIRTTEQQQPSLPQGPNSGHAQGDEWRFVMKRDLERMTPEEAAKQDPRGAFIAKHIYHKNEPRDLLVDETDPGINYARPPVDFDDVAKQGPISDSTRHQLAKELTEMQASKNHIIRRGEGFEVDEDLVDRPHSFTLTPLPSRRLRRSSYGSTDRGPAKNPQTPESYIETDDTPIETTGPIEFEISTMAPTRSLNFTVTPSHNATSTHNATTAPSHNTTTSPPSSSPTSNPLAKRQRGFLPNELPTMWEDHMHGVFDVQDVTFGEGKIIPRPHKRSAIPTLSTTLFTIPTIPSIPTTPTPTLIPRSEPDDESLTQKEYDDLKKGKGAKGKKGGKGKRELPEETKRLLQGDVYKTAKWWNDFWKEFWHLSLRGWVRGV